MRLPIVLSIALLSPATVAAESLERAEARGEVHVDVTSVHEYSAVRITIRNTSAHVVTVTAAPGVVFENEVATEQDVTLTEPLRLTLSAGKSTTEVVASYCTQVHDAPPTRGVHFHVRGYDSGVTAFLERRYDRHANRATQHALWHFLAGRTTEHVPVPEPIE